MKKGLSLFVSATLAGMLFTGCATTELQTQSKMSRSIFLNPVKKSLRVVYVDVKNTSGQELNNFLPLLEKKLIGKGYKLTDDPDKAKYVLMVNTLFANDKKENNAANAAALGTATGVGIGGYNGKGVGSSLLIGAGVGLVTGLIGKFTEDTIYQMVVDINIREKTNQKVYTTTGGSVGQASVSDGRRAGFMNTFGGKVRNNKGGGSMSDNITESSSQQYSTNYIEKRTTIFAEATKMNLKLQEALPILEEKMSSQIAGIF